MWLIDRDEYKIINTDYVIMFGKEWAHQDAYTLYAKLSNGDKVGLMCAHVNETEEQLTLIKTLLSDRKVNTHHIQRITNWEK